MCLPELEKTPASKISIRVEAVQKQSGAVESGVYAIANLVELLTGGDPRKVSFDTKQMRQHLSRCFSSQKFESFPKQSSPVARTSDKDTYRAIEVTFTSQKY